MTIQERLSTGLNKIKTPTAEAFEIWLAGSSAVEDMDFRDDNTADAMNRAIYGLTDQVLKRPSRDALDVLYKLMAYTFMGEHDPGEGDLGDQLYADAFKVLTKARPDLQIVLHPRSRLHKLL